MKVADYIVQKMIDAGTTDAFGIPGGVILKLLYAMKERVPEFTPHLSCHEQAAGFAACGYAHASGKLGVAYATRGPGISNMFTCIAEAYQESLPVLFVTAHGERSVSRVRFSHNQELDFVSCVSGITKYSVSVDCVEQVCVCVNEAINKALSGRKGPVVLDISSSLWEKEIVETDDKNISDYELLEGSAELAVRAICDRLKYSRRPVFLIGDGLRHVVSKDDLYALAEKMGIPFLSSRGSQDLMSGSEYYYGYIGSHGTRYSNYILSKSDLIISVGNRLAVPVNSLSYRPVFEQAYLIRVDIDENEFSRDIVGSLNFKCDGKYVIEGLLKAGAFKNDPAWLETCMTLKRELTGYDCPTPVNRLESFIRTQAADTVYVCDVGNNELWFSRAFEKVGRRSEVLCPKSFAALGSALGKAIGAYFATGRKVVCVCGDQGFQFNSQELQFIKSNSIPMTIVIVNNE
ncbi:MAG: thiamine pyrophosphate-binding protein, partial [Oscillospiraceae bacterium]|nr:thiamine pyrophosphate-binding protein [Oscillospiraceae bacterium]